MAQNEYGSLCTEMYEILHPQAPQDELAFYLSYARPGMTILEPLCGSGRFLIPFLQRGYEISGIDASEQMLDRLRQKAPCARAFQGDVLAYEAGQTYDYIFISSGSVSLFTDGAQCRKLLLKMKELLKPGGLFVFAVDTVANRRADDGREKLSIAVKTAQGRDLLLKETSRYDEATQTQYTPGVYELYDGPTLLRQERMDFQTHLYRLGELEPCLREIGFAKVTAYSSYQKTIAVDDRTEMFLYECTL